MRHGFTRLDERAAARKINFPKITNSAVRSEAFKDRSTANDVIFQAKTHRGRSSWIGRAGAARGGGREAPQTGKVTLQRVPGHGIQPQVVVDSQGVVHLIYFRGEAAAGDVYYARFRDGGAHFTQPLRVNSQPESAIAIGNIQGAHLAVGKQGRVHVAWMGSGKARGQGRATPMLYARLNDEGTAFEPERNAIDAAVGLDGGGSVCADDAGNVWVAWHAPDPGAKGEANRRVWLAQSTDDGKTFAREKIASAEPTGVCGCCGMKALCDRKGHVYLLYRSATKEVNRDTYLLISNDRGQKFTSDKLQKWNVGICPMSSFALAATGDSVLAGWETDGQVFFCRIHPATGKRSEPIAPPGAARGRKHPVLAGNARGETILVWTEGMGWNRGGAVAWQVYDKDGKPTAEKGRADGVPTWSLAAVFARADGGFTIVY